MAKETAITEETFNTLLDWLDHNRETAGLKYEKIRQRLIRIFTGRGCFEAEELADETINRVMQKLPQLANNYVGEPALYFYGVAEKLHLEWMRKQKKIKTLQFSKTSKSDDSEIEAEYQCLQNCLERLPFQQHELIIEYYREEKTAKIENRKKIAERLGISPGALQIKALRIRTDLRKCVLNCISGKNL